MVKHLLINPSIKDGAYVGKFFWDFCPCEPFVQIDNFTIKLTWCSEESTLKIEDVSGKDVVPCPQSRYIITNNRVRLIPQGKPKNPIKFVPWSNTEK